LNDFITDPLKTKELDCQNHRIFDKQWCVVRKTVWRMWSLIRSWRTLNLRKICCRCKGRTSVARSLVLLWIAAILGSCGGEASSGAVNAGISALSCNSVQGETGLYWDFSVGRAAGRIPLSATVPPNPVGGQFLHPKSLTTFSYPAGWSARAIVDPFTIVQQPEEIIQGVTVDDGWTIVSPDQSAIYRYLRTREPGFIDTNVRLNQEIQSALNTLENPLERQQLCSIQAPSFVLGNFGSLDSALIQAGDTTIVVVTASALIQGSLPGMSVVETTISFARTSEFGQLALSAFIPMRYQLYLGGTAPAECEDNLDNDGDLDVDFGQDRQCDSPGDDDESA